MRVCVVWMLAALVPGVRLVAQPDPGRRVSEQQLDLLAGLASEDALDRELARRRLSLAQSLPEARVVGLLGSSSAEVVAAAASLLRERRLALPRLQGLARHADPEIRKLVVPVATDLDLTRLLSTDPSMLLRIQAMYQLEDRGLLTDELLLGVLLSTSEELRDAACRLIVYERSPFPLPLANKLLKSPPARGTLLRWLADRPRASAGPWLVHVLGIAGLGEMDRLLAIHSLPPDWIDIRMAREVTQAAAADSAALNARAVSAAARFSPAIADRLVPVVLERLRAGRALDSLLPVLVKATRVAERQVFEAARDSGPATIRRVAHWLTERESQLVSEYIDESLDGDEAFPTALAGLAGPALRVAGEEQPRRVEKLVAILQAGPVASLEAFASLLEAEVYRPEMFAFAQRGAGVDRARRMFQIFRMPSARLPARLFERVFAESSVEIQIHAIEALARQTLSAQFERTLLGYALKSKLATLRSAASRAIVRSGSAAAGRQVYRARGGDAAVVNWLVEWPRAWSRELLLESRAAMTAERAAHSARYHQILVALARLGETSAVQALVRELAFLRPPEFREARKLLAQTYKAADLERLARQHLVVKPLAPGEEMVLTAAYGEGQREDLVAWFAARRDIQVEALLVRLWKADRNYQVRLAALRGLLARDSKALHSQLVSLVERPAGEEQEELAFEVVGSMSHPVTDKALELLARILLLAPLQDPRREVRFAMEQGYDGARGAYPLNTPASVLLRRDEDVQPGAVFAAVAAQVGARKFALNRQRLGLLFSSLGLRPDLQADLGPVLAKLILEAPDLSLDFVGPAQWVLAEQAEARGDLKQAAHLYEQANRAFCRGVVPTHIQRSFCGDVDPARGLHPYAALAAQAIICRARLLLRDEQPRAADRVLVRARDLAEGDAFTIERIQTLRRAKRP